MHTNPPPLPRLPLPELQARAAMAAKFVDLYEAQGSGARGLNPGYYQRCASFLNALLRECPQALPAEAVTPQVREMFESITMERALGPARAQHCPTLHAFLERLRRSGGPSFGGATVTC